MILYPDVILPSLTIAANDNSSGLIDTTTASNTTGHPVYDLTIGTQTDPELIKLCENGDIIIRVRKIDNDICLVDAMREFLLGQGLYNR